MKEIRARTEVLPSTNQYVLPLDNASTASYLQHRISRRNRPLFLRKPIAGCLPSSSAVYLLDRYNCTRTIQLVSARLPRRHHQVPILSVCLPAIAIAEYAHTCFRGFLWALCSTEGTHRLMDMSRDRSGFPRECGGVSRYRSPYRKWIRCTI